MQPDETNLWNLFVAGDKEVLGVFYKRYYNLLYNYGLKFCTNKTLVQDFIQDIFLKLYKSDSIGTTMSPRVYLLKSLRNMIFDYYTSYKEHLPMHEPVFLIPEEDVSFEKLFSRNDGELQRVKRLISAISGLSDKQKQILYLHYIKGLSHKEIAEILDINVQSSMNSLSRTLAKLRTQLNGEDLVLLVILCNFIWFR